MKYIYVEGNALVLLDNGAIKDVNGLAKNVMMIVEMVYKGDKENTFIEISKPGGERTHKVF